MGNDMKITLTTSVKVKSEDYESFKILNLKKQRKLGETIGDLISEEVRKNLNIIKT